MIATSKLSQKKQFINVSNSFDKKKQIKLLENICELLRELNYRVDQQQQDIAHLKQYMKRAEDARNEYTTGAWRVE